MKKFFIVPHSHLDREWYRTFQENRVKLTRFMDDLLDTLDEDPDYTCYTLDAQTSFIDDYFDVKPQNEERFAAYVKEGKLPIGPWYVQPDEHLPETFDFTFEKGQGDGVNEDVCFTLDATDRHAVCAPEDVYAMTTGSYMQVAKEVAPTLMARDYKDPTTIAPAPHLNEGVMGTVATGAHPSGFNGQDAFNDRLVIDNPEAQPTPVTYTVRRLTPTECARLQGFPDWWCRDLGTENPTEEELAFWADVFETHRKIVTHAKKSKTEKQIRKWLADPYTDSAEYRIWGNGICLANAFFVLAGIAWCAGLEE